MADATSMTIASRSFSILSSTPPLRDSSSANNDTGFLHALLSSRVGTRSDCLAALATHQAWGFGVVAEGCLRFQVRCRASERVAVLGEVACVPRSRICLSRLERSRGP